MKKTAPICIVIAALLLMLTVVSAGCVQDQAQQPAVGTQIKDGIDFSKLTVDLKTDIIKEGVTYNVGDTMEVRLQSYPYLGFEWTIKKCEDGISVVEGIASPVDVYDQSKGMLQSFTITALAEGDHGFAFELTPMSQEAKVLAAQNPAISSYQYADTIHVVKSDEPNLTPRGMFSTTSPSGELPRAGNAVEITVNGNPSSGYQWIAQNTDGLVISDPVYTPYKADEKLGIGGTYSWKITAAAPGTYKFTALNLRDGDNTPASRIIVDVIFT
ncbi:MAG: protease inhibitor I42 family protein [Methanocorpusculum sp.]|nr:protease inhibitor I42 family protein [Methanocorpusculum sp.]